MVYPVPDAVANVWRVLSLFLHGWSKRQPQSRKYRIHRGCPNDLFDYLINMLPNEPSRLSRPAGPRSSGRYRRRRFHGGGPPPLFANPRIRMLTLFTKPARDDRARAHRCDRIRHEIGTHRGSAGSSRTPTPTTGTHLPKIVGDGVLDVPCRTWLNLCQCSANSQLVIICRRAGRLRPPLTESRISQAGASNPPYRFLFVRSTPIISTLHSQRSTL